ncbi:hypothetical protein AAJ76_441000789 [Vairimorpha ceranae]|uniref:Uncharacterized protein n=1 Tax=Vairimorpha ceranae TaxID=40302 RepID=A0A0F9WK92_9MICR|nr:hypothetical protein AAJ76_441000789 [Vairimorpha ceranae]KKO73578.1 hypothetical protein AAJ76_441000789 [Vairimorpha ceranae]
MVYLVLNTNYSVQNLKIFIDDKHELRNELIPSGQHWSRTPL